MAWIKSEIVVSGETVEGQMNKSNDTVIITIPYIEGIEVGSTVTSNSKDFIIKTIINDGDRGETLTLGVEDGEHISRRTKGKSK